MKISLKVKGWPIVVVSFCLFLALGVFTQTPKQIAAEESGWLSTKPVLITERETIASTDDLPPAIGGGNIPCSERVIKTRPSRPLMGQAEETTNGCVVETQYGSLGNRGLLQRPGSSLYGPTEHPNRQSINLIPIPRSSYGLYITGGTYLGSYYALLPNMNSRITSNAIYDGKVTHTVNTDGKRMITGKSGTSVPLRYESMSFSANGEWMLADSPVDGTYRINIHTGEALLFRNNFNYNVGTGVNMQTAITNDGRFAVVASKGFSLFRIYDLSTCDGITIASCKYKSLLSETKQYFENFSGVHRLKFLNNETLEMYIVTGTSANTVVRRVLYSPHGSVPDDRYDYLGLGDSFSSGEGAFSYKAFTDTDENKCHVSLVSYPFLIGQQTGMTDFESVACSGAKTKDVRYVYEKYNEDESQAKRKDNISFDNEIYLNFLPGYRIQNKFTEMYKPTALTLGIGGNNIGFDSIIKNCVGPGTCYNSYSERKMLMSTIDNEFDELVRTYNEVKASSPHSRVYVHGYPSIVSETGECDINVHLNDTERKLANDLVNYLNRTVEKAARKAGVYYVDVENAFKGYRLCEKRWQWELAVNGLTAGDDKIIDDKWVVNWFNGPVGNESFHPNARGHQLYADAILNITANLTAEMPSPDSSIVTLPDHTNEALLDGFMSSTIWGDTYYENGATSDVWFMTEENDITVPRETMHFQPGSNVEVWLHSTPTELGTFSVNASGVFSADITLLDTIQPGYHTLHLLGTNSSGEKIDIYDYVYVAASRSDWDGDGINNEDEACYFGEPSGRDTDQDGIDDACDGFISQPPAVDESDEQTMGSNNSDGSEVSSQTAPSKPVITNSEESILLATAESQASSENKSDGNVLGESRDNKQKSPVTHTARIIQDKSKPIAVLATLVVSAVAGAWVLVRRYA